MRRDTQGCDTGRDTRCLASCRSSEKLFTGHLRTVHLGEKGTKMCPAALISGFRSTPVGSISCPALLAVYVWGLHNFPGLVVSREARCLRSKHGAVGGRGRATKLVTTAAAAPANRVGLSPG